MPSSVRPRELTPILKSVVKVLAVSDPPDYDQPWQTRGATSNVGSGAIVALPDGLRVITNAHCVANHVFVEVRRYGKSTKHVADVEAIGHECDLALLKVADPAFFDGTHPIPLGGLPRLSDRVSVCGFPVGGERLSITEGIVSRIEIVRYAQRRRRLLAVQIDAAINPGNSGGPVVRDGKMVGIAFQGLEDAQLVGYMIATPVVEHFLNDTARGLRDGFPGLGVRAQPLESPAHRRMLGLPRSVEDGVLINQVIYGGSAWGVLHEEDVLLAIDDVPVAADGTISFRDGELLSWDYTVSRRSVGDTARLDVWRGQARHRLELELKPPQYLVAEDQFDERPSYFIYAGLLFVPLTRDYLKTWGDQWWAGAPRDMVALYETGYRTADRIEPVVLQKVLADEANIGYHQYENLLVSAVDGQPVRCLAHLVELVEQGSGECVRIRTEVGLSVVVDRAVAAARRDVIAARYSVPRDRSSDLGSDA